MYLSELIETLEREQNQLDTYGIDDIEVMVIGGKPTNPMQFGFSDFVEYRKLDGESYLCLVEAGGEPVGEELNPEQLGED